MDRRTVLRGGAAAGMAAALPRSGFAQQPQSPGTTMRLRAAAFLNTLDPDQRRKASFDFDDPVRRAWTFMHGSRRAPGLGLEDITPLQQDTARDLLASALSARGHEKAEQIMLQQDILRDEWQKGSPDRNRDRFSVMIFGTPAAQGAWGWRWEGHHLSLSFTLVDDVVVSLTPSAFSSEPNSVPSGPHAGLVVLQEEEVLGRALFMDLSPQQRRAALVNETSPGNILTTNGRERRYDGDTRGLTLAEMSMSQRDMMRRLIEVYTSEPYGGALGAETAARVGESDLEAARFIWAGADLDGSIYYRLHGDTFLIEFATLRRQPQHLHAVYHDVERVFGQHVI